MKFSIVLSLFFVIIPNGCEDSLSPNTNITIEDAKEYSLTQLKKSLNTIQPGSYPIRTKGIGECELTSSPVWASGFFPAVYGTDNLGRLLFFRSYE